MPIFDLPLLAALLGSYLLGAIPFGLLLARMVGAGDIRTQGSGNIGATNVLRTAGKTMGILTLVLDMGKGFAPVLAGRLIWGAETPACAFLALAAFLGHLFPVYLGFKGGKGVATGLGIFLAWVPTAGGIMILVWLAMAKLFRFSSLAALTAFALLPLMLQLMGMETPMFASLVISTLLFWKHRGNIRRLLQGSEPRIGRKEPTP